MHILCSSYIFSLYTYFNLEIFRCLTSNTGFDETSCLYNRSAFSKFELIELTVLFLSSSFSIGSTAQQGLAVKT